MQRILFLILLVTATGFSVWSQTATISRYAEQYHHAGDKEGKRAALMLLLEQYRSMDRDSLLYFAKQLQQMNDLPASDEQLIANFYLVFHYSYKGQLDSCFSLIDRSMKLAASASNPDRYLMMFSFARGGVLVKIGQSKDALLWYFKALPLARQLQDQAYNVKILNGVGWAYMGMELYRESANWFLKAIAINKKEQYWQFFPYLYANLASSYGGMDMLDSAKHYIGLAVNAAQQQDDLFSYTNALAIQANLFVAQQQYSTAIDTMHAVIRLRKILKDPMYVIADMVLLAEIYAAAQHTTEGIQVAQEAIRLAKKMQNTGRLRMAYRALGNNYQARGDYKALSELLMLQVALTDSLSKIGITSELTELQSKYNVAKTEKELAQLEAKASTQALQLQREKNARKITLFAGLVLIMGAAGAWIHFHQKSKSRLQQGLLKAIFETEQKERMRIARDLHDSIGQLLSVVKIQVSNMKEPGAQPGTVHQTLDLVDKTIQEVRDISHNLIPEELNFGLVAALDELADIINESGPTRLEFRYVNDLRIAGPDRSRSLSVYRIVQEIVSNMLRHAGASRIGIHMYYREKSILLHITDDGKGFDINVIEGSKGLGWKNINARVQLLNGKLHLRSEKGKGTHIEIVVPYG